MFHIRGTVAVLVVAFVGGTSAHGGYTFTAVSLTGNANHNLSGIASDSSNASDSLPGVPVIPEVLSVSNGLVLSPTNSTYFNTVQSNTTTLQADGVDGNLALLYDYSIAAGTSGSLASTVRTIAIFDVVGFVTFDLLANFDSTGPGNFVQLKNELTGDFISGTGVGGAFADSGLLTDGTYRLTVRFLVNMSTSGVGSVLADFGDRTATYDLTLTTIPAPSGVMVLGVAGMVRRKRH